MRRIVRAGERPADGRLAGPDGLGVGLELRRVALAAGERTPELPAEEGERMLYVIRGGGTARAAGAEHELARESVLWLEPGDRLALEAGPEGLEALLARAPAR